VCLFCVKLTSFAGAHNLTSIGYRSWSVKTLSKGVSNKGSGAQHGARKPSSGFRIAAPDPS
jgi:hypothetical protein